MNLSRSSSGLHTLVETRTGLAELKTRISEACELWPESRFYLQQLSFYICRACAPPVPDLVKAQTPSSKILRLHTPASLNAAGIPRLSQVVVAEGHLSPASVVELASQHPSLPLEFFLGHLELERVSKLNRTSYESPALPSRRGHIVHVRLPTLWRCNDSADSTAAVYPVNRAKADTLCIQHEKRLLDGGNMEAGATRFRKVHMHNWGRFTVEQVASLCLIPDEFEEGAWIGKQLFMAEFFADDQLIFYHAAVYALDSGKPLPMGSEPFPRDRSAPPATAGPTLQPTVRYSEATLLRRAPTQARCFTGTPGTFSMHPYHPCQDFGVEAEFDPFSALASLLSAASASWNQVLNFIDEDIEGHQDVTDATAPAALAQVRFNLGLVHRFQGIIQQDVEALGGSSAWNDMRLADITEIESCDINNSGCRAPLGDRGALTRDYESLLMRCRALSQRCESASQGLQSTLLLLEHQRSQVKTEEINKLTKMGLFFFPSSLVATIFGMSVVEMDGANKPKLWHAMVAVFASALFCWAMYYSPRCLRWMRTRCHGRWRQVLRRRGSASPEDMELMEL